MDWLSATALADLAGTTVADRAFMACYRRQQELVPSLSASDPLKVAQPDADLGGHERRNRAALTRAGARPIGLDLSEGQLAHARRLLAQAGVHVPLVQVSAEAVPLADASFDIVFCDHGAMNFADPTGRFPRSPGCCDPVGCSPSAISRRSPTGWTTSWYATTSGCTGSTLSMRWCSSFPTERGSGCFAPTALSSWT